MYGGGGSLILTVPGLAESVTVTVVGRVKTVPTYFAVRSKCSTPAEVVFEDVKIGVGSCVSALAPTFVPSQAPTQSPAISPVPTVSQLPTQKPTSHSSDLHSDRATLAASVTVGCAYQHRAAFADAHALRFPNIRADTDAHDRIVHLPQPVAWDGLCRVAVYIHQHAGEVGTGVHAGADAGAERRWPICGECHLHSSGDRDLDLLERCGVWHVPRRRPVVGRPGAGLGGVDDDDGR